jgi:hypothetical protein
VNAAYSVHNDPSRWQDPDTFEPLRYIDYKLSALQYAALPDAEKRDHFAYGAGRRICAGMAVAETSLFLLASRLLWAFDIKASRDADGNTIPIDTHAYAGESSYINPVSPKLTEAGGVFAKPEPFAADISIRNERHAEVVREEFAMAQTSRRSLGEAEESGDMATMEELIELMKRNPDCKVVAS